MEKERRVKWLVIASLIVAVLGLTIAFAALSETLTINGTATLDAAKWGIKFENLKSGVPTGDATVNNEATIAEDKVTINNIDVTLKTPGDSVTYKVDLVNSGTINAKINEIKVPELTEEQKKYIDFKVTYEDGEEVKEENILNSGTTKNLTIKIEFKKDITESDLPSSAQQINLSYKLKFVQTDLTQDSSESGSGGTTDNYGNEIRSWNLSDTVKMTYYNGELQSDGTYDNGTLVISGEGAIPDGNPETMNLPIQFKLADVSSYNELQMSENGILLKYNPTNLIIEDGITNTGVYSFALISTLTNVTLSSTVTDINIGAFYNSNINEINGKGVINVYDSAFENCNNLTNVYLQNCKTIGEYAFRNCALLKKLNIESVLTINDDAFYNCSSLSSLNLPNVTSIGYTSFAHCSSLENVYFPNIEIIGTSAFSNCTSLKSINIGNKINIIGTSTFVYCSSLKYIYISGMSVQVGDNAFGYQTEGFIADDSVIYVPDEATKNKIPSNSYNSSKTTIVVDPTKFQ